MDLPAIEGRRILVTGGAGFIGSHFVEALAPANEVRLLEDFSTGSRADVPDGVAVFEGDVRDASLVARAAEDVDLIVHLAAMIDVAASVERPRECHEVNLDATLSLLERARAEDARLVFPSSAAIYGHPESVPIAEDDRTKPTSPYGVTKLAGDHYCRLWHERYGVETVILRYFNVFGPRQSGGAYSGVIGVFVEQGTSGEPITVHGDGSQTRDFVHVDDVVRATVLAAETDAVGEAFNVGTGDSVSILELAETVREVVDGEPKVVHTDPRPGDVDRSVADVGKARSRLGFEPTVTLREGIAELVERRA